MSAIAALRAASARDALRRPVNLAGFLLCAALIAYALYAQFDLHLDPCPLCIFQRIGIAALGVVFLLAALQHPRRIGAGVYALLLAVAALATLAVAGRQIYLQHLPPWEVPSCGAPLSVMLKFMPVTAVIRKVLNGSGECGVVNWTFVGLSMPEWVALCTIALAAAGIAVNLRALRPAGSPAR